MVGASCHATAAVSGCIAIQLCRSWTTTTYLLPQLHPHAVSKLIPCFESDVQRTLGLPRVSRIEADVRRVNALLRVSSLTTRRLLAKRQRIGDGAKIVLDIAKESSDFFPFLKSALGFVNALIKHYEVMMIEWVAVIHT